MPSSPTQCVTCRASKLGASAIHTLRSARAENTHAIRPARSPAFSTATRFVGNGELKICSSEKGRGGVSAEQAIREDHSNRTPTQSQADNFEFPCAAEYVKQCGIDNWGERKCCDWGQRS